ncbi:hypothetical protein RA19_23540 [Leisingera sp. ANG-M1]|uniref:IclR family transcriptional regulator n=1 Tax=Leisingera sp. ANG-M1 TaxID=1577895 RepID=UPI00057E4343|nr:IclR family transcriptional regulator [Leisingera sp. ANG-M1]KIC07539.1 hypothetical protein RA19_23540 [Leisingera sp. ANG-M1]
MQEPIPGTAALAKGFMVLRAVSDQAKPSTLAELQKITGLPKGTLHRILQALTAEGVIRQDSDHKTFQLGFGLLRLAGKVLDDLELRDIARDILTELRDETGEAVHLAVPEARAVVYVEILDSGRPIGAVGKIGSSSPYHCASAGKAIAAFDPTLASQVLSWDLPELTPGTITSPDVLAAEFAKVRQQGFATNFEEEFPEVHGVAAPVLDRRSKPVASVSITIPSYRFEQDKLPELSRAVRAAANAIGNRL